MSCDAEFTCVVVVVGEVMCRVMQNLRVLLLVR